jgi:CheY-like chemotaxis protein
MATAAQHVFSTGRRALVVDDSQIARFVLRDLLEREGFEVETADSAEAGLDQLATSSADVVFMDHMLPGMQGLDAVRRIRSDGKYRDLPVIMYTSQEGDAFARMARAAGADDIYLKTADTEGLVTVLQRLGLVAERSPEPEPVQNVVPLRDHRESIYRIDDAEAHPDAVAVVDELLPVLEQHRARLRQDLLAEFAILERHEERMRRELAAHVEAMTRRAAGSFADAMQKEQARREARRRSAGRRWLATAALVAAVAFGLALGMTVGAPETGVVTAYDASVGIPD